MSNAVYKREVMEQWRIWLEKAEYETIVGGLLMDQMNLFGDKMPTDQIRDFTRRHKMHMKNAKKYMKQVRHYARIYEKLEKETN